MCRTAFLFLIFIQGYISTLAQQVNSQHLLTYADSNLIKQEKPYQFHFGQFFKNDTVYAILLDTLRRDNQNVTLFGLKFFEKVGNKWLRRNEYDSLPTWGIHTRFCNFSKYNYMDYLVSADIAGTGGNETEYLFIFDKKTRSLLQIKGFENLPNTTYNRKNGLITSIGLVSGVPSFEYFKIEDFRLIQVGGKEMWADNSYGYLTEYKIISGRKIIYKKEKRKLPIDFYKW
jgi:hypothetical protein